MSSNHQSAEDKAVSLSLNIAFRLVLAGLLVVWCFIILGPFVIPVVTATILAVAFKGIYDKLVKIMGGRKGLAATVFAIVGIALVVWPSVKVAESLLGSAQELRTALEAGTLQVPPPPESLQNLPAIGERAYDAWHLASDDMQQAVVQFEPQIRAGGRWVLKFLAGMGSAVLHMILALIIAAFLLCYAEPATRMLRAVSSRFEGNMEEGFVDLAAATINSVAQGVLGIAIFQATLLGVGLFVAGIPAAGLFTVAVLILAVVQVPVLLVMILPIIWGFSNMSIMWAIVWAVFAVLGSASDMPLKAVFLGRGVSIPTGVILLGAIGGMVSMGMIGLFIGAIVLGLGYKFFQVWLGGDGTPEAPAEAPSGA